MLHHIIIQYKIKVKDHHYPGGLLRSSPALHTMWGFAGNRFYSAVITLIILVVPDMPRGTPAVITASPPFSI